MHDSRALPPTPAGEDPVLVEVLLRRTRAVHEMKITVKRAAVARARRQGDCAMETGAISSGIGGDWCRAE